MTRSLFSTDYYITAPELELNHGYCDFFLLPDLTHYASQHSYILELKVLSKKDFSAIVEGEFTEDGKPMTKAEKQWREAVEQIHRYAEAPRVEALRQGTKLHLIMANRTPHGLLVQISFPKEERS